MSNNTMRSPRVEQLRRTEDDAQVHPVSQAAPAHMEHNTPLVIGVGILGVITLLLMTSWSSVGMQSTLATTGTPMATTVQAHEIIIVTSTPMPTPSCVTNDEQLALITELERRGEWRQAADTAETTLIIVRLCPEQRHALTRKALTNGLKALYTEPVELEPFNREAQQGQVDRWLRYRERALNANVDFPSPLVVAREATTISHHRLAAAAVEVALAEQEFNPRVERDITKLYISALYGICYWETNDPTRADLYTEGLSYCVTSHKLAVAFKTGQAEAANLLRQLRGDAATLWPAPYRSPLLNSTS